MGVPVLRVEQLTYLVALLFGRIAHNIPFILAWCGRATSILMGRSYETSRSHAGSTTVRGWSHEIPPHGWEAQVIIGSVNCFQLSNNLVFCYWPFKMVEVTNKTGIVFPQWSMMELLKPWDYLLFISVLYLWLNMIFFPLATGISFDFKHDFSGNS